MNTIKSALYVGSFDPVTFGHLDIIKRASKMFDKVTVAIGENPGKKYMFSFDERLKLMLIAIRNLDVRNVLVEIKPIKNLTADFAKIHGHNIIIKGARTSQDFDYERLIHEVSLTQQRNLETVLLFSDTKMSHISSSAVKELAKFQGLIHDYVPLHVKAAIEKKNGLHIIGVTGTIGSGKSTLCKNLSGFRINHINMDLLGHEIFTSDLPIAMRAREQILETFGTVDKKELGEKVFGNPFDLVKLNSITKEPILTLLREKLIGKIGVVLLEGALLTEMDWLFLCNNEVIVVKTPSEKVHSERLSGRGLSTEQIERRIKSQYTFEQKRAAAVEAGKRDGYGVVVVHDTESKIPIEDSTSWSVTRYKE